MFSNLEAEPGEIKVCCSVSPHTAGHRTPEDIHTRSRPKPRGTCHRSGTVRFHIYSSGFHSDCRQNQEDIGSDSPSVPSKSKKIKIKISQSLKQISAN